MADSMCPKCEAKSFEVKVMRPESATTDLCFVQCSKCGTVVGITETINMPMTLKIHGELLNEIRQLLKDLIAK